MPLPGLVLFAPVTPDVQTAPPPHNGGGDRRLKAGHVNGEQQEAQRNHPKPKDRQDRQKAAQDQKNRRWHAKQPKPRVAQRGEGPFGPRVFARNGQELAVKPLAGPVAECGFRHAA